MLQSRDDISLNYTLYLLINKNPPKYILTVTPAKVSANMNKPINIMLNHNYYSSFSHCY